MKAVRNGPCALREVGKCELDGVWTQTCGRGQQAAVLTPNPTAVVSHQGLVTGFICTPAPFPCRSPLHISPSQVRGLLVLPRGFHSGLAAPLPCVFHFDDSPTVSVITQVSIKIYSCYCSSHFPQYMCIVFGESHNHSPHPTDAVVRATPASTYQTFLLIWDFTNNHKRCSLPKISALSFLDCVSGKALIRAPAPRKAKLQKGFAWLCF